MRKYRKCLYLFVSDTRQTSHTLTNVFSQLVYGKSIKPDFNAEEKLSVEKDKREIRKIVREMAEFLPQEDPEKGIETQILKTFKHPLFYHQPMGETYAIHKLVFIAHLGNTFVGLNLWSLKQPW